MEAPAAKRRGRPPGSKNKSKDELKPKPAKPLKSLFKKSAPKRAKRAAPTAKRAPAKRAKRTKKSKPVLPTDDDTSDIDEDANSIPFEDALSDTGGELDESGIDAADDSHDEDGVEGDALEDDALEDDGDFSDDEAGIPAVPEPDDDDGVEPPTNPDCYLTERDTLKPLIDPALWPEEEELYAKYKYFPDLYKLRLRRLLSRAKPYQFPATTVSSANSVQEFTKLAIDELSKFTADDNGKRAFLWCKRCRTGEHVRFVLSQTRSADEGMTCICTCTKCGERWFMS